MLETFRKIITELYYQSDREEKGRIVDTVEKLSRLQ